MLVLPIFWIAEILPLLHRERLCEKGRKIAQPIITSTLRVTDGRCPPMRMIIGGAPPLPLYGKIFKGNKTTEE